MDLGTSAPPRMDTVETVHNYLIDYLSLLLTKVHEMARIKGKTKTEDLMYFLEEGQTKVFEGEEPAAYE